MVNKFSCACRTIRIGCRCRAVELTDTIEELLKLCFPSTLVRKLHGSVLLGTSFKSRA
jgi:hypothetical protein